MDVGVRREDHRRMDRSSQERHDAVVVEIAYAVLSSVLLIGAAVALGALVATLLELHSERWTGVGWVLLMLTLLAAAWRTVAVLIAARRRGL
jgi:uncharacterized protein DUF6332